MKKKFISLALAGLLVAGLTAGCGNASGEAESIEPPVEETEETAEPEEVEASEEEPEEEPEEEKEPEIITVYLPVREITNEYEDGTHDGLIEREYDDYGNITKWTSYASDGTVGYIEETEYEYDGDGRILKKTQYNTDEGGERYKYSERENEYDANGKLLKSKTTYEPEAWMLEELGQEQSVYETEYNDKGNEIKIASTQYYTDGTEETDEETYEYEYDADGRIVKETLIYASGEKSIDEYEYDEHGEKTKESSTLVYEDGTEELFIVTIYENTYDENGNKTEEVIYDGMDEGGDQQRYLYEYDANGNVIKETHIYPGDLEAVTEYEYIEMQVPNV